MIWAFVLSCLYVLLAASGSVGAEKPLRLGMIGCDTSHAPKFTTIINEAKADDLLSRFRVVAAFPTKSDDVADSYNRIVKFTDELRGKGVQIVGSVEALLPLVDAVMIESVDGRKHLEQVQAVVTAGKPIFVDKPMTASLADAMRIFRLTEKRGVPCFSSSALRFSPDVSAARQDEQLGKVVGCETYSPCKLEPHHPDLMWYGVHGVEMLYTIMGPGCESVSCTHTSDTDLVVGRWKDGRVGTFRGLRRGPEQKYGATIYGENKIVYCDAKDTGFRSLLTEVGQFFLTGKPPVSSAETLEIFAFMEAAQASKDRGGSTVKLDEVMQKARAAVDQ